VGAMSANRLLLEQADCTKLVPMKRKTTVDTHTHSNGLDDPTLVPGPVRQQISRR
jgi:hypothetical protein